MKRKSYSSFLVIKLTLLALLAAATTPAHATAYTWNGSTNLWSTTTAWTPNVTPLTASDDVLFDSTASGNYVNGMGTGNQSVKSITFNSATSYTNRLYSSSTTTTTTRTLTVGSITNLAGNHTIVGDKPTTGTGYLLLANATFDIATSCTLTFDVRLRQSATGVTYSKTGAGTLALNSHNGGTAGWTHSGFTVSEGVLRFTAVNAFGTSGNDYTVSSGAALEISGGVSQVVNAGGTNTLNGTGIGSAGALRSVSGNNSFTGSGDIILNADSSIGVDANTLSIAPVISGASRNLTKVGAGTLTLNGVNTYSGTTTVSVGTLLVNGSITSAVTNLSGATFGGTGSVTGNVVLESGSLALFTNGATLAITGNLTLNNNTVKVNLSNNVPAGTYTLATYSGTSSGGVNAAFVTNNSGSLAAGTTGYVTNNTTTSAIQLVVINVGTPTTTTVSRSAGSDPSTYGSALTFKAAVVPGSGSDVPTGTVQFRTNGVNYGSPVSVVTDSSPNGKAEVDASTLPYNAAAYTNTAVYTPSGSFQSSSDLTGISQTINQAAVTVSGAVAKSKMFDGTTAATITGTLVGVLPADNANVALSGTGTFASADVGSGISVTVDSCTLVGSAAGNYSLTPPTGPLSANILDTGIWSNPAGGLWHTAANWTEGSDHVVATGTNNTADFNQVSLSADTTVTLAAPVTIGNLIFGNTNASPAANWILNSNGIAANKLTLAGTNPTVTVNNLGSGKTATISAVVDGTNGLTKSGLGTLVLDNRANLYTGNTVINLGILQIGNGVSPTNGSLGTNSSAFIANGALLLINRPYDNNTANVYQYSGKLSGSGTVRSATGTRLDFINTSQPDSTNLTFDVNGSLNTRTNGFPIIQIGELTGSGTVGRGGNGSSSEITYVIGAKNTDSTFSGAIVNSTVQKVGSGKLTLTGTNAYAGTTTISDGTLEIGGAGRIGSGNYAANITNNGTIRHNSTAAQNLGGIISGGGILIKTNSGTLTLGGANTYTGDTTISGGTLLVNGSTASGSAVTVNSGTLGGTGTINGSVTINGSGTLEAGASLGTLTIGGPATNNGTIRAEITNGPSADRIVFSNSVHNLGGTLTVTNLGTLVNGATYDLFDFNGGAPTGVAFAATNLPGGLAHWNTSDLLAGGTITFANNVPTAAPVTTMVAQGGSVTITNNPAKTPFAADADGDALTYAVVTGPAEGTVSVLAAGFTYTNTNTVSNITDTFTYSVADGLGGSATNTMSVYIGNARGANLISATELDGKAYLTYAGIPGYSYVSELATNLLPPIVWTPVATNTAGATNSATPGLIFFTNDLVPPTTFFRTQAQ